MRTLIALVLAAVTVFAVEDPLVVYRVRPDEADPAVHRFIEPHYVVFKRDTPASADLLLFLSGSGGAPANTSDFLGIAAAQGYRVISLAYNDTPSVVQVCGQGAEAACSASVREKRLFGKDVSRRIDDTPEESIVHRLVMLLAALERDHPAEQWGGYLDGGAPRWARIAIAGHSQGAGMAAFVAQRFLVARVVLFSSPWDFYGPNRQLAPWIEAGPGATPSDRWFAAYHQRENTAALIARAYQALRVPPAHVRVFTLESRAASGANPYHVSMVGNGATPRSPDGTPAYADNWRFLVGSPH